MREPAFPDHVIAAFDVPPGWPSPNEWWLIDNQFWRPPPGWTPRAEIEPAPSDWVFWDPKTTEFSKWVAPALRGYTITAWLAAVVAAGAGTAWAVGASTGPSAWFLGLFAAVAIGVFVAFCAINMRSGRRSEIIYRLGERAPAHRRDRIDARYDSYVQRWREGARTMS